MGGFVFDMRGRSMRAGPPFLGQCLRLTLTAKGVALLGECGLLPRIERDHIEDKNKSDSMGKTIACIQVIWLVVSVLARVIGRLPITSLEVNTLGHVLCALIVYALWWNKPRWVMQPTKLEGEWVRPMAAFMFLSSRASGQKAAGQVGILRDFVVSPGMSELAYHSPNTQECHGSFSFRHRSNDNQTHEHGSDQDLERIVSAETQESWALAAEAICRYPTLQKRLHSVTGDKSHSYEVALEAYPEMPARAKKTRLPALEGHDSPPNTLEKGCRSEQLVTVGPNDWPSDDLIRSSANGLLMGTVLWLATVAYGAVHIAAWNIEFPSRSEMWIWRGSALYIAVAGVLWFSLHVIAQVSGTLWWLWYDILSNGAKPLSKAALYIVCGIGGLSYTFARGFVVVEAFISLRSLPSAAYLMPDWTISIPHI